MVNLRDHGAVLLPVAEKEHDRYVNNTQAMVKAVTAGVHLPPRVAEDLAAIEALAEQQQLCCVIYGLTASVQREGHSSVVSTLTPRPCRAGAGAEATDDQNTWYECACTCKKKPQVRFAPRRSRTCVDRIAIRCCAFPSRQGNVCRQLACCCFSFSGTRPASTMCATPRTPRYQHIGCSTHATRLPVGDCSTTSGERSRSLHRRSGSFT